MKGMILWWGLLLAVSGAIASDSTGLRMVPDSAIQTIPGSQYRKSVFYRFFMGTHYRPAWIKPVSTPVLDLRSSGLVPYREGGSRETKNVRMKDALGREWVARSVDKDLSKALTSDIQRKLLGWIMRDQVSANFPYAPLLVPALAKATDVYYCPPVLCVLPDEESLESFRPTFGNMLVTLEPRPHESWADDPLFDHPLKVLDTKEFLEKTDTIPLDTAWFLKTRLLDMLIGDWSRHEDQYRWILLNVNGKQIYRPVPRDRDHAFYRFNDGLVNKLIVLFRPNYQTFDKKIHHVAGLNRSGRTLDERLLSTLSFTDWNCIAAAFQAKLSDAAISEAVNAIPAEIREKYADKFASYLKSRRDTMDQTAKIWYRVIHAK